MKRWFLPAQPDLMGLLAEQGRITLEGIDAFVEWAAGAAGKDDEVRDAEHRADDARRAVQRPCGSPSPPRSAPKTSTSCPNASTPS